MTEQTQDKSTTSRCRSRLTFLTAAISLLVVAVALIWSRSGSPSIEERLAAIEAARAIPEAENAAGIYNVLLQDPNVTLLLGHSPDFFDGQSWDRLSREFWLHSDHPQLAQWIAQNRHLIDRLLEAGRFEKCRFPIIIDIEEKLSQIERIGSMLHWASLLRLASNNDIAEGRIDAAITKWTCVLQMGRHLRQQPTLTDWIGSTAVEEQGSCQTAVFLAEGSPDDHHLEKIASLPLQVRDDWATVLERIRLVEKLAEQKRRE